MKQKDFDDIIKANLLKHGKHEGKEYKQSDFGYRKGEYENYFEKNFFGNFIKTNNLPAYKGDELSEKGKRPPKMASVGSSSRFCYLALKDWAENKENGIEFEKECKIDGICGMAPQLDAYIAKGNIYIEAKCHEIFTPHSIIMSVAYKNMLCENFGLQDKDLGKTTVNRKRKNPKYKKGDNPTVEEYIKVPVEMLKIKPELFKVNKEETMFDIKQFLCHLSGIASSKKGRAKLVYMFFRPLCEDENEQRKIDEVFRELKDEIETVFHENRIKNFCKRHGIDLCAVVQSARVMEALANTPDKNYDIIAELKSSDN